MDEKRFSISHVSHQTGLSTHVIRVWERRYHAIAPQRSTGNQRLYGQDDVDRLILLRAAVDQGLRIGSIADLSNQELESMVESPLPQGNHSEERELFLTTAEQSIHQLDQTCFINALERAKKHMGIDALVTDVLPELQHRVGDQWQTGKLRIFHERFASEILRSFLGELIVEQQLHHPTCHAVAAAPRGQYHEFGVLSASAYASIKGKTVLYLGANIPLAEVGDSARGFDCSTVFLGFTYPFGDKSLAVELGDFARSYPQLTIVCGGPAAAHYVSEAGSYENIQLVQSLKGIDQLLNAPSRTA